MSDGRKPAASYWHADPKTGAVVCELCPHHCRIAEGHSGICKVRKCEGAALVLPYFGLVSSLALDPIEKKPLHHFLPGSEVFSAGFVGCNMRCPFCQNWGISQEIPSSLERMSPESLVAAALRSGAPSIAYTYSEPTIHFEFVLASMAAARAAGLRNVLVTNGCLEPAPARELLSLTDAANVDLKTWSAETYRKTLGGSKDRVLEFMGIAASLCHLEVTTLVVPPFSDSIGDVEAIAGFVAGLSPDIALHLSAYHPAWKHEAPPIGASLLSELARAARSRLRYVYKGNLSGRSADTYCQSCGNKVIGRTGYRIDTRGLAIAGSSARCARCGSALPIIV